jgi:ABC-type transport system involved in multi-copper enzyme maturation permease subunit
MASAGFSAGRDPTPDEDAPLAIMRIIQRELVVAARRYREYSQRNSFAAILYVIVFGTIGAWYYWEGGHLSSQTMRWAAYQAFLWTALFHCAIGGIIFARCAPAIAAEKDSRTLDFLLATRLNNAEIILGKLASCLIVLGATAAAGLPLMLALHVLGGVDLRLILLTYAAVASLALFLTSMAIWISTEASSVGRASSLMVLWTMAWVMGPFVLAMVLPRYGLRLPEWAATVNAWLLASSPVGLAIKLAPGGIPSWYLLLYSAGWMMGLQLAGSIFFLAAAILRLRRAYRRNVNGEPAGGRTRHRLAWRFRPRPAVGDDPILWRERYTTRTHGLVRAAGSLISLAILAGLAYGTYYFARPALLEVWRHGYGVPTGRRADLEFNLFVRMFVPNTSNGQPIDQGRVDFNVFLRYVTTMMTIIVSFIIASFAAEILTLERAKQTWTSLLATPLTAREILRAAILSATWRLREVLTVLMVLWTIGLIAGAIHPVGYLAAVLELAASIWFLTTIGALAAIQANDLPGATNHIALWTFALIFSGLLPILLPNRWSSVLLGAGSTPFVVCLSQASYRDIDLVIQNGSYTPVQWFGMVTSEGPMRILAACLLGILGPALGGLWVWRYSLAHFDRLVGRPWRRSSPSRHREGTGAEPSSALPRLV